MAGSRRKRKATTDAIQSDGSEKVSKETESSTPGKALRVAPPGASERKPSEMIEGELYNHRSEAKRFGYYARKQR
ncbi:hypothetical protein LTS18_012865, partial [Coniosporium uncinatum]